MDRRRRFIPHSEGLERRALLATSSNNLMNTFGFRVTTNLNIPITYQQKELRAQHLPYYMEKIRPGRYLPQADTQAISAELTNLISKLHKPPAEVLNDYNNALKHLFSKESINAQDAQVLNKEFGRVLIAAQASPTTVQELQSTLYQLVTKVDTASPEPTYLATNDYSLVLQTALSIGRPMPSPVLPRIAKGQGVQADNAHIKTSLKHPTLVGTYHFHTNIQIVTSSGVVVGQTAVKKNNSYKVRISKPLSPGVYQFRILAYDTAGNPSRGSAPFLIKVTAKPAQPSK